jgi:ribosomal-protein-alanine N-acetyltransferase
MRGAGANAGTDVAGEGPLRTERLVLVALVPPLARAAVEDRGGFERLLGARVPEPWPMADFARMLPQIATGHEEGSAAGPTRLVVAGETLVGETGFHGPPDRSGTVEVGYGVLPSWRGQGIATEATRALISHAFDRSPRRGLLRRGDVERVVARCLPENPASLKVLEKIGMRRVGRSGEALLFEVRRGSWRA